MVHLEVSVPTLKMYSNTLCFFRVNVARNDLPWEFMVDRVPSILLFPKYR